MLPHPPDDENLQQALQTSQHALLLMTICMLEDLGFVSPVVLSDPKHTDQQHQRQLVTGLIDQLLGFCAGSQSVSLNADFVRHELRLLEYKHNHHPHPHC